jgi:hypothetical protein
MIGDFRLKPNGWRIVVEGAMTETAAYNELFKWAKSHDVLLKEDAAKIQLDAVVNPAKDEKDKPAKVAGKEKVAFDIHGMWNRWYDIVRERNSGTPKPAKMRGDEAGMIKTILEDYGEETATEIFNVAVFDWDAFCMKHSKLQLPNIPDLKSVVYHRRELAAAVGQKGVTTAKHRVSEYGQKKGGAYDDWVK